MSSHAKLGCTSETKHKMILTEDVHPIVKRPYGVLIVNKQR